MLNFENWQMISTSKWHHMCKILKIIFWAVLQAPWFENMNLCLFLSKHRPCLALHVPFPKELITRAKQSKHSYWEMELMGISFSHICLAMEIHTRLMSFHTAFVSFVTVKFGSLKREMASFLFSQRANQVVAEWDSSWSVLYPLVYPTDWLKQSCGLFSLSNVPKKLQSSEV